jgi:four helix bundle protein
MAEPIYNLEERLLEFSVRVIRVTESMKRAPAGVYVAAQLLRSATSPYGHHGEAEGAESRDDFIHKLRVCYKELREARRWLRLVQRTPLVSKPSLLDGIITEAEELVRIFAASIRTAGNNRPPGQTKKRTATAWENQTTAPTRHAMSHLLSDLNVKRSALNVERSHSAPFTL